jgi:hypothetical protein
VTAVRALRDHFVFFYFPHRENPEARVLNGRAADGNGRAGGFWEVKRSGVQQCESDGMGISQAVGRVGRMSKQSSSQMGADLNAQNLIRIRTASRPSYQSNARHPPRSRHPQAPSPAEGRHEWCEACGMR